MEDKPLKAHTKRVNPFDWGWEACIHVAGCWDKILKVPPLWPIIFGPRHSRRFFSFFFLNCDIRGEGFRFKECKCMDTYLISCNSSTLSAIISLWSPPPTPCSRLFFLRVNSCTGWMRPTFCVNDRPSLKGLFFLSAAQREITEILVIDPCEIWRTSTVARLHRTVLLFSLLQPKLSFTLKRVSYRPVKPPQWVDL